MNDTGMYGNTYHDSSKVLDSRCQDAVRFHVIEVHDLDESRPQGYCTMGNIGSGSRDLRIHGTPYLIVAEVLRVF